MTFQEGDLLWSRLEPISKDPSMDESLRAQVVDPLWLMTRQWQLGEFQAEDGGSPVDVEVNLAHDKLSRFHLHGRDPEVDTESYEGGPLEAIAEREHVLTERDRPDARPDWDRPDARPDRDRPDARLAAQAGAQFRRLLAQHNPAADASYDAGAFPSGYLLSEITDEPDDPVDVTDQRFEDFVADRVLDGHRVYLAVDAALEKGSWSADAVEFPWEASQSASGPARFPVPDGASASDGWYQDAAVAFREWYAELYNEPTDDSGDAWDPERLEYRFSVATGGPGGVIDGSGSTESVLTAREYPGGRLDWHSFSVPDDGSDSPEVDTDESLEDQAGEAGPLSVPYEGATGDDGRPSLFPSDADEVPDRTEHDGKHVMPTKASFKGMPNVRYWEFEDADVRLDDISSDDVSNQILMNFALVYGNDWYTFPIRTPLGSLTRIRNLTVTDTFGQETTADPVTEADDDWNMFMVDDLQHVGEPGLFLPPVLDDKVEGEPVESVSIGRDEMANMAFAIEETVESAAGRSINRDEYTRPQLVVEEVAPNPDVAEEYVALHNPGNKPLEVSGWIVSDGSVTYTFGSGETVAPDTTIYLHTGTEPVGENSDIDYYWGIPKGSDDNPKPVWYRDDSITLSVYDDGADDVSVTGSEERPLENLRLRQLVPGTAGAGTPEAAYRLATDLADHWFALQPFRLEEDEGLFSREVDYYLRLSLVLDADTLDASSYSAIPGPEGEILEPYGEDFGIYDEELLRGGKQVTRSYQQAQWIDGTTYLWSGREVTPGSGEVGSDTLQFDVLSGWAEDEES